MIEFILFTLLGSVILHVIFGESSKKIEEREEWDMYADDYRP